MNQQMGKDPIVMNETLSMTHGTMFTVTAMPPDPTKGSAVVERDNDHQITVRALHRGSLHL